ncbi:hypothetical protein ACPA54_04290 [Uniformispora flossi]|uniref:hypothetical protein n=1 Tax=Uniformispora flossi TaxID=3390723 RepID=UPI003C2F7319
MDGMAWRLPRGAIPGEDEQVRHPDELLDIFEEDGVGTALWFAFADYDKPGNRGTASHGVVACWTRPAGNQKGLRRRERRKSTLERPPRPPRPMPTMPLRAAGVCLAARRRVVSVLRASTGPAARSPQSAVAASVVSIRCDPNARKFGDGERVDGMSHVHAALALA